jgi:hypothetical protein
LGDKRGGSPLATTWLLESLGEEAVSDIQFLFEQNNQPIVNTTTTNPNLIMSTLLWPLNFAAIQGAPHTIPDTAIEKLSVFQGNNAVSAHTHILNFDLCTLKWCRGHDEEDVKMTLFLFSLEGDAAEWFSKQDPNKFSTLAEIFQAFRERWGDQKENRFLLVSLSSSQKKKNETMDEFNKRFNDLVKSLPTTIKPSYTAILIYYMEAFEGEMRYQLRDKDLQTIKDAQVIAMRINKNMPIFLVSLGTSSQPYEEKKKKIENQGSSDDGIKELTQLIKQMELNHVNQIKQMEVNQANQIKQMEINQANQVRKHASQMNAMQNSLIAMERTQSSRPQHRSNDKWPKRPPPQDQRPSNPFESTNLVDHQAIPYCRPYGQFHEESTCQVFLQVCNEMGPYRTENEQVNMSGHEYNVGMYEWMDLMEHSEGVNCNNVVVDRVTKKFGPKPTPQQVSEKAGYRGITYQRNGNKNQDRPQGSILGMPPPPPKTMVHASSDLNIDLGG